MRILALDLSSVATGWAFFDGPGQLGGFGVLKPPRLKNNKTMSHEKLVYWIYSGIQELMERYMPEKVVVEDQYCGINVDTLKLLSRICGAVMVLVGRRELRFKLVPPSTVKKQFTGKGNAKKPEMVAKAKKLYGIVNLEDDNIADAIAIGHTAYLPQEEG